MYVLDPVLFIRPPGEVRNEFSQKDPQDSHLMHLLNPHSSGSFPNCSSHCYRHLS